MARDLGAINQDAARLREQAKALHDASDAKRHADMADANIKMQAARRDETAQQATLDRADKQLVAGQDALAKAEKDATDFAAQAANEKDPVKAEELREEVNHSRAEVAAIKDTVETIQQAADQARAGVEAAQAEQARIRESIENNLGPARMEQAADQLDDKARWLEETARLERKATVAEMDGDKVTAQEQRQLADDALMRSNHIQPDVSQIDAQVLQDAGVDPSTLSTPQQYTKDDVASLDDAGKAADNLDADAIASTNTQGADSQGADMTATPASDDGAQSIDLLADTGSSEDAGSGGVGDLTASPSSVVTADTPADDTFAQTEAETPPVPAAEPEVVSTFGTDDSSSFADSQSSDAEADSDAGAGADNEFADEG